MRELGKRKDGSGFHSQPCILLYMRIIYSHTTPILCVYTAMSPYLAWNAKCATALHCDKAETFCIQGWPGNEVPTIIMEKAALVECVLCGLAVSGYLEATS